MDLKELTQDDLLNETPPSLREAFVQFLKDDVPLDTVGLILVGSKYSGVTLKGGNRFVGDLWESVKKEFREFLCTEGGKYDGLRKKFPKIAKDNQTLFIAQLSVLVGGTLGVQAGLIVPIILWLLLAAIKLGKEAVCAVLSAPQGPNPPASS